MNKTIATLCATAIMSSSLMLSVPSLHAASPINESILNSLPSYNGTDIELQVNDKGTFFTLWSPQAEEVKVNIYDTNNAPTPSAILEMKRGENGTWKASVPQQLYGKFYTFQVKFHSQWLKETPGDRKSVV